MIIVLISGTSLHWTGTSKKVTGFFLKRNLKELKKYSNARIWFATTIEEKLDHFLNALNNALKIACPKKRCKCKFKYPPWWDENLTIMRSKLRKLAKNKSTEGKNSYISIRREYKKSIKTAKSEGWKKFTSEIKHPSDVSKLIKSFNNSKNNALGLLKNKDGEFSDNPEESLNTLLKKFFPCHTAVPETDIMDWSKIKK